MLSVSSAAMALGAGSVRPTPDACGLTLSLILKMSRGGDHLEVHPVLGHTEPSYGEHETAATPSCSLTSSRASFGGRPAMVARRWWPGSHLAIVHPPAPIEVATALR